MSYFVRQGENILPGRGSVFIDSGTTKEDSDVEEVANSKKEKNKSPNKKDKVNKRKKKEKKK